MKENIEEDIIKLERFSNETILYGSTVAMTLEKYKELQLSILNILSDYKRVLKENEELKKRWDKDTHKLQNDLDIANAKRIDWEKAYQEEKDKQFELVRENQKLESENEELKKELGRVTYGRNQLFEYATAQQANPEMLHKILRVEYISKQKIQDKIEELNEYYKKEIYPERFHWADVDITEYYDGMIDVLQELLEEKGE